MNSPHPSDITRLLQAYNPALTQESDIHTRLLSLVYDELRSTARGLMARERVEHTLQPTALVHEAWLRLFNGQQMQWNDRAHFLGILAGDSANLELLDLDKALTQLAELDPRAGQVAEMRIFGGLTMAEIAHNLNVSKRTCDGDWQMARLWLTRELGDQ